MKAKDYRKDMKTSEVKRMKKEREGQKIRTGSKTERGISKGEKIGKGKRQRGREGERKEIKVEIKREKRKGRC